MLAIRLAAAPVLFCLAPGAGLGRDARSPARQAGQGGASVPVRPASGPVQVLLDEADAVRKAGNVPEALAVAGRARAAAAGSGDRPGEARAEQLRGELLGEAGRDAEAREALRRAAALFESGDGSAGALAAAAALNRLGERAFTKGGLATAQGYFADALGILERRAADSLDAAVTLNNLGIVAMQRGDFTASRQFLERTLGIRERLAPGSLAAAATLNNLGILSRRQGDLANARRYYERSLAIKERAAPPGSATIAASLNNLGVCTEEQGDLTGARQYYSRALEIQERLAPDSLPVATSLANLGIVSRRLGDLAAARQYHARALAIRERLAPDSLDTAGSVAYLGIIAMYEGDLPAARQYYSRALEIQERLAPDSLFVAATLNNLGLVAARQRDPATALEAHTRALRIQERLAPDSLAAALSLNNLGVVHLEQGRPAPAQGCFARALRIQERLAPDSLDVAQSLANLGRVAVRRGEFGQAADFLGRSLTILRHQSLGVAGDEARMALWRQAGDVSAGLADTRLRSGAVAAAFEAVEAGRAQALQQTMAERQVIDPSRFAALNRAFKDQEAAMKALSAAAARQTGAATGETTGAKPDPEYAESFAAYTRARVETEAAIARIRRANPVAFPEPLSARQLQDSLPANTLYVTWVSGEDAVLVFLLERGRAPFAARLPVTPGELTEKAAAFRKALLRPDGPSPVGPGRVLFAALFPPEARRRVAAAERLLLSPTGPLWSVPLGALVLGPGGPDASPRFLGIEKSVTYTPSLTVFALVQRASRSRVRPAAGAGGKRRCLTVGDPVFSRPAGATAVAGVSPATAATPVSPETPLVQTPPVGARLAGGGGAAASLWGRETPPGAVPSTGEQAKRVAALYGATPLLREGATEAAVRARLPDAEVIHIASHGRFLDALPMGSGVLLTEPERRPDAGGHEDDGALQAWEFLGMRLHADLAVFGACEVGLGESLDGEGVVGMTRALQVAGVLSSVVSLWQVEETSTGALMVAFHRHCRDGVARDEALRRAMKALAAGNRYRHPYYWAPFVLFGDNGPLAAVAATPASEHGPTRDIARQTRSRRP